MWMSIDGQWGEAAPPPHSIPAGATPTHRIHAAAGSPGCGQASPNRHRRCTASKAFSSSTRPLASSTQSTQPARIPIPLVMTIQVYWPPGQPGTLEQRGLDFLDAESVFAGPTIEVPGRRRDYGELWTICFGLLRGQAVIVVYTERSGIRHIISMRKTNEREQRRFLPYLC